MEHETKSETMSIYFFNLFIRCNSMNSIGHNIAEKKKRTFRAKVLDFVC